MLKLLLVLAALLYHALLVLVFCYQDLLVFPGSVIPIYCPPVEGVATRTYAIADGRQCRLAVARPAARPGAVMLYFVGNGEGLGNCRHWAAVMAGQGFVTFCPEYPGYARGSGAAAKSTCLEAADIIAGQARAEATRLGVPLFVVGHSLGTFMAVHVAAQGVGDRLLLVAPPTSILDRGEAMFPFLPVRCLLRHDFDNLELGPRVRCPTLVIHGDRDRIVPVEEGRRVAGSIPGARILEVPRGDHDPAALYAAAVEAVRGFLR